jgi:hypothetical protein
MVRHCYFRTGASWIPPVPLGAGAGDLGAVVSFRDITDRKRAEAAHEKLAICDPLTGLLNQGLLKDRLDQAMNRALTGDNYDVATAEAPPPVTTT